jgi:hypothetical protein
MDDLELAFHPKLISVLPEYYSEVSCFEEKNETLFQFPNIANFRFVKHTVRDTTVNKLFEDLADRERENVYHLLIVNEDFEEDELIDLLLDKVEISDEKYYMNDSIMILRKESDFLLQKHPIIVSSVCLTTYLKSMQSLLYVELKHIDSNFDDFEESNFKNLRNELAFFTNVVLYPAYLFSGTQENFTKKLHSSLNLIFRHEMSTNLINTIEERLDERSSTVDSLYGKITALTLIPLAVASLLQLNLLEFFDFSKVAYNEKLKLVVNYINPIVVIIILLLGFLFSKAIILISRRNKENWLKFSGMLIAILSSLFAAFANVQLSYTAHKIPGSFLTISFINYLSAGLFLSLFGILIHMNKNDSKDGVWEKIKTNFSFDNLSYPFKAMHISMWVAGASVASASFVTVIDNMYLLWIFIVNSMVGKLTSSKLIKSIFLIFSASVIAFRSFELGTLNGLGLGLLASIAFTGFTFLWSRSENKEKSLGCTMIRTGQMLVISSFYILLFNYLNNLFSTDKEILSYVQLPSSELLRQLFNGLVIGLTYLTLTMASSKISEVRGNNKLLLAVGLSLSIPFTFLFESTLMGHTFSNITYIGVFFFLTSFVLLQKET